MVRKPPMMSGFTLVEMAMVVLIIGLVMMTVFPALTALRTATQRSVTENNMQAVMRAIAIYAQNHGCLPCPTLASTVGNNFGLVPTSNPTPACGKCTAQPEGIVPFVSLGIPQQFAKDGWGRWLTMRVDPGLTRDCQNDFSQLFCSAQKKSLCVSGVDKTRQIRVFQPGSAIAQPNAVILVSHGANGYGAFVASAIGSDLNGSRLKFPDKTPSCNTNPPIAERCNADTVLGQPKETDTAFTTGTPSNDPSQPFDDLLLHLDHDNLATFLGGTGCTGAW